MTFGTSGLLYRSNKLMFDEETHSLWSSLEGVPVVGTSRRQRPPAAVSLRGHDDVGRMEAGSSGDNGAVTRDRLRAELREGVAYRDYFATDPDVRSAEADTRLKNKAEVLVLRPEIIGKDASPVAISVERLRREPSTHSRPVGAIRCHHVEGRREHAVRARRTHVSRAHADGVLRDTTGRRWNVTADGLVSETGEQLARIPAHRAFWFGWVAQYPQTVLHK